MPLDPLPLVTNCHTFPDPLPLERDILYGRPHTLATFLLNDIYYPVIDTSLSEVGRRFGGANRNIMCGIGALAPGSGQFLEYSSVTKFAEQYKSNVGDLALELKQMKRMIECKTADNTM